MKKTCLAFCLVLIHGVLVPVKAQCGDFKMDYGETDTDCGGSTLCSRCTNGRQCQETRDCSIAGMPSGQYITCDNSTYAGILHTDNFPGSQQALDNRQPGIHMRYIMQLRGQPVATVPTKFIPVGFIRTSGIFAQFTVDMHDCDGASLAVADYPDLYDALGNTWGGDATAFNLPNLLERVPVGSTYQNIGEIGGENQLYLTQSQMYPHRHFVGGTNQTGMTGQFQQQSIDNRQAFARVSFMICVGVDDGQSYPFVGQIMPYAGVALNVNGDAQWRPCEGQWISTQAFSALFAVIGYTYGGSGIQFGLPDLRDRVLAGTNLGPAFSGADSVFMSSVNVGPHDHGFGLRGRVGVYNPVGSSGILGGNVMRTAYISFGICTSAAVCASPRVDGDGPWESTKAYMAEITAFAGPVANLPTGWESLVAPPCRPMASNIVLLAWIGDRWGLSDSTTVCLPYIQDRVIMGSSPANLDHPIGDFSLAISNPAVLPVHSHTTAGIVVGLCATYGSSSSAPFSSSSAPAPSSSSSSAPFSSSELPDSSSSSSSNGGGGSDSSSSSAMEPSSSASTGTSGSSSADARSSSTAVEQPVSGLSSSSGQHIIGFGTGRTALGFALAVIVFQLLSCT